jgi:hypothetical protein
VFLGTPTDEALFVGLYSVMYRGLLEEDQLMPHMPAQMYKAASWDRYDLTLRQSLSDLIGRLVVDWGARQWVQYPHKNNKPVVELRAEFKEPDFPGFLNFIKPLSEIDSLPSNWITALKSCRGIYCLSCPRTKEQYVGSATGEEGFWQRWQDYVRTRHGGNVTLKSRDPSDYQVSILEVAGSALTDDEISKLEQRWMKKIAEQGDGLKSLTDAAVGLARASDVAQLGPRPLQDSRAE